MKIDAHQHFWKFDPDRDAWITQEMHVIRNDFFPDDLFPLLEQNGISGTVAVQADQSAQETDFLLGLAHASHFIKGVVGWIDLKSPSIEREIEKYSEDVLLKGFRHIVQAETDPDFLNRPDFIRGIKALHKKNYTYDLLIYQHQLPMAVKFLQQFPDQPFVLDHIAKPLIKSGIWKDWAEQIRALAAFPNVMCKVSGMVTEADWSDWKPSDFKIYLDVVSEAFGANRLMYGSDWPVCLVAADYKRQLSLVEEYFKSWSATEQTAIFGGNAIRFYKL
jgi:L-fuconolactonase